MIFLFVDYSTLKQETDCFIIYAFLKRVLMGWRNASVHLLDTMLYNLVFRYYYVFLTVEILLWFSAIDKIQSNDALTPGT